MSPRTRDQLKAAGHDVVWVGDWSTNPGDEVILETARQQSRVLITLDRDFGELAVVFGRDHAGIIRVVDVPARMLGRLCTMTLDAYGQELAKGALVTVHPYRVRVRPPGADEL